MGMAVGDKKGGAIADINVTPMADVIIVLLIIFMVITPMLQKGVDVRLPTASNTAERKDDSKSITVAVKKNGECFLASTEGSTPKTEKLDSRADLTPRLKDLIEATSNTMIYLKADQELAYSEVMDVLDYAREAGVEEVALIAEAKVEG